MPHPLTATREQTAVLVLDLQGRLMDRLLDRAAVVANTVRLCRVAGQLRIPVLATEQNARSLGPTLPPIREAIADFRPVDKMAFSAFGEEKFVRVLKDTGRPHLAVCGIMSHVCVCQTVLDAVAAGYIVHLVADAVSCWKQLDHDAGLEKMRKAGAVIASTELVIYEWLRTAGTPEFKAALPFLKEPGPPMGKS